MTEDEIAHPFKEGEIYDAYAEPTGSPSARPAPPSLSPLWRRLREGSRRRRASAQKALLRPPQS